MAQGGLPAGAGGGGPAGRGDCGRLGVRAGAGAAAEGLNEFFPLHRNHGLHYCSGLPICHYCAEGSGCSYVLAWESGWRLCVTLFRPGSPSLLPQAFPPSDENEYAHLRLYEFSDTVQRIPPEDLHGVGAGPGGGGGGGMAGAAGAGAAGVGLSRRGGKPDVGLGARDSRRRWEACKGRGASSPRLLDGDLEPPFFLEWGPSQSPLLLRCRACRAAARGYGCAGGGAAAAGPAHPGRRCALSAHPAPPCCLLSLGWLAPRLAGPSQCCLGFWGSLPPPPPFHSV